jgi:hypothetical protein
MGPMKDFVRDVWKIAASCAAGAFLLSLVIGLIAGNPFGIAFFRAFLFALLFSGMGAGLRVVVKGYLPELMASNSVPEGAAADNRRAGAPADHGAAEAGYRGAAVDIVLPEDDALRRQAYSGSSQPSQASTGEPGEGELVEELDAELADADSASQAEAQALGELAEELGEELPDAADGTGPAPRVTASARSSGPSADQEPVQEAEAEDELSRSARQSAADLDSLPDIAALEPPSEERPGMSSVRYARLPKPGERPEDAVREVLSGQDPATLARALRTVLKKDEKG